MSWLSGRDKGKVAAARVSAPRARTEQLAIEDLGDEVLIYDQTNDQAHCLSRDAAMVWRVCDGTSSAAEIATALELEPETVVRAIEELDGCGLLDGGPIAGVTRREATIRMAKVGGAAAAAPLIYSIIAPTPALASSQAFCLSLSPCGPGGLTGCSDCYHHGCVCCGAGTSGSVKLCTADCSTTYCNGCVIHNHCGGTGTDSTCTCGSSGVNPCTNAHNTCPNGCGPTCVDASGNPICCP